MQTKHHYQALIELFNQTFYHDYMTKLVAGDSEPLYQPANASCPYHQIIFAHGFYASAIHEISHWCIAGARRRLEVDYGYWYCPDGRSEKKQAEFEVVEIAPQALDWMFCQATGYPFHVSCDNLDGDFQPDRLAFKRKVHAQVLRYLDNGLPKRAAQFLSVLQHFYQTAPLTKADFSYPE